MNATKELMEVEKNNIDNEEITSPLPTKFNLDDWSDDHFLFLQHLKSCKSSNKKRNLSYITAKRQPITATMTREVPLIHSVPLTGAHYDNDNKIVYQKLRTWLTNHCIPMEHICEFAATENGRAANQALENYFDGPGEIKKQLVKARAAYSHLFYKSEPTHTYSIRARALCPSPPL
mmetsp:Transcript_21086/g.31837  ORF Transcript_21086/g.31837 Transcript_21086/m.31837 type:complete len:176 (-) Transcript_21086:3405-3932(-)